MKTKLLLLIGFLACQTIFAQNNTGIAVQGIARDAEKSALVDELLTFTFDIQDPANGQSHFKEEVAIRTDPYGVFSHIIGTSTSNVGNFNEVPFGQTHMKLLISVRYGGNDIEISNAPFQYAPYAKSAENGVPTGSIMPYIGNTAPPGWVICNGQNLTNVPGSGPLRSLLGTNDAPDLQGMFLRGTGTSPVNQQAGPALRQTQGDLIKGHSHEAGTLKTANDGEHYHMLPHNGISGNITRSITVTGVGHNTEEYIGLYSATDGAHSHNMEGSTSESGGEETRPINYGVNYIIKL